MAADTSVFIARKQQGEQSVAWVEKLFFHDEVLRMSSWVSTWWKKLFFSPFVWQRLLLYLLPDSSRGSGLWLGWKNHFLWRSVEDESRSPPAWGKRLLSKPVVWQWILLYLLPEGSSVNRLCPGWVLSFSIFWTLHRQKTTALYSTLISKNVSVLYEKISVPGPFLLQNILLILVRKFADTPSTNDK